MNALQVYGPFADAGFYGGQGAHGYTDYPFLPA